MPVANTKTTEVAPEPTVADRIADAIRLAADFSHEARLVTSMARDAGEEGAHAAKRAVRRMKWVLEKFEELRDDAAHYAKRQTFRALGFAFRVGLQLSLLAWLGGRFGHRCHAASPERVPNR